MKHEIPSRLERSNSEYQLLQQVTASWFMDIFHIFTFKFFTITFTVQLRRFSKITRCIRMLIDKYMEMVKLGEE